MTFKLRNRKAYICMAMLMAVLLSNVILHTTSFAQPVQQGIVLGSLVDFLVVIPLIIYFFIIRKKHSLTYMAPIILASYLTATFIIPEEQLSSLQFLKLIIFSIEGLFLIMAAYFVSKKVPLMRKAWNNAKTLEPFFNLRILNTLADVFGEKKAIRMIASELSVFHYSLFSWKKGTALGSNTYTYHQKSSYIALNIMLIHAVVLESVGFHFWLHSINEVLSWILLGLNAYAVLFFLADIRAVLSCPIRLEDDKIIFQIGIMKTLKIRYSDIKEIQQFKEEEVPKDKRNKSFNAVLGGFIPEPPQYEIILNKSVYASYPFGLRSKVDYVHVTVDESQSFYGSLQEKVSNQNR
ncbi:hypothetical protein CVD28_15305 [Bacillus sp. M6-12]|uniref:hypothetical protein n=1 Tax=Bacillus sp. M6-12 TaxID=2054166 RepID=UPI000CAAF06F|nr:hypothetical protein [Bacillus sp. M6-12]PLS16455.1 hypothetical protein CVD28_15305 [Bacillus sp. M6-12]